MRISDWSSDVCSSCLADAELGHEAVVSAVLGHIADAGLETLASAVAGDVLAVEQDLSGVRLDQAEQRLDQLGLSVALDPGDPDDLAGPDLERDVLDHLVTARVDHGDPAGLELHVSPGAVLLLDAERDRSAGNNIATLGLACRRVGGAAQLDSGDTA